MGGSGTFAAFAPAPLAPRRVRLVTVLYAPVAPVPLRWQASAPPLAGLLF